MKESRLALSHVPMIAPTRLAWVGALLAWAIAKFTPIPAAVPLWSVVAALVMSAVTGVFFGMYPATKASRLDPVEALRYE